VHSDVAKANLLKATFQKVFQRDDRTKLKSDLSHSSLPCLQNFNIQYLFLILLMQCTIFLISFHVLPLACLPFVGKELLPLFIMLLLFCSVFHLAMVSYRLSGYLQLLCPSLKEVLVTSLAITTLFH